MQLIKHTFFKTYFLAVALSCFAFYSCNFFETKHSNKIIKHTVFVIEDKITKVEKQNVDTSYLESLFKQYNLVDINTLDSTIKVNLKYADTANFLHLNFYDGLKKAYLPCEVANHLCNAQFYLKQININYSLVIFDAVRPLHLQQLMWDSLKIEPNLKYNYLAPPYQESLHNYGCAIDLSIIDISTNILLDMGTEFDAFTKLSQPAYEWQFLKTNELTSEAFENRKLLRKVMQLAKFYPITSEWWHFNYCTKEQAMRRFELVK